MHVAYKTAAMHIKDYNRLLETNEGYISQCVYDNIYHRHICRLFNIR
jgi:tagaturonate epimerase